MASVSKTNGTAHESYVRVQTPRADAAQKVEKALHGGTGDGVAVVDEPIAVGSRNSPFDSANWLSKLTIWWMTPLIRQGFLKPLSEHDVWKLPKADSSEVLQAAFDHHYQQEKAKLQQKHPEATEKLITPIHIPMWNSTKSTMALAIALYLTSAACSIIQPLLIKALLLYFEGSPNMFGISSPYALAGILIAATFGNVTCLDFGMFLTMRAGLNARMIVVNAVYQKILKLTTTARQSFNSGDIITLAGVDSERLFEAYALGLWVVNSPLMITTVCILIGVEMGWDVGLTAAVVSACILFYAMTNSREIGRCRRKILGIAGERVKVTNESLQGIRVIKMYTWEDSIAERVRAIRDQEIKVIRKYDYLRATNLIVLSLAVTFLVVVCFFVYVYKGRTLDVPTAFTLLSFANVCRQPFGIFSNSVVFTSEAIASMQRIAKFLAADEISQNTNETKLQNESSIVEIRDGDYTWGASPINVAAGQCDSGEKPNALIISNINLTIPAGSLTIIVGAVGSGKSSLVNAILGEMHQVRGTCAVRGSVAYASQQAWIQHNSVRGNILFGSPFDQNYYNKVISACQLQRDLDIFEAGDQTEIGERGINLSGGQKARVSLARVIYRQNADLIILDDPLSALDVHVANSVFFECIVGLVKSKTRILVLNAHYHLLPHADRIIMMADGQIVSDGTYEEAKSTFSFLEDQSPSNVAGSPESLEDTKSASEAIATENNEPELTEKTYDAVLDSTVYSETPETMERMSLSRASGRSSAVVMTETVTESKTDPKKTMMLKEDRQVGAVGAKLYTKFFSFCGYNGICVAVTIFFAFAIGQGALLGADYYVKYWSNGSINSLSQKSLLWLYVGIVVVASVLSAFRTFLFTEICVRCSRALHSRFFYKVIHAPVTTFFDVTPLGQILNRFSRDLDQIDNPLTYYGMNCLILVFTTLAIFIVCAVSTVYTLILYVPMIIICYYIQIYYLATSLELKRLDGVTRSPFLNLVSETINGIESIRSYQMTNQFSTKCRELLDHNCKFFFSFQSTSRWYAVRLDWMVSSVVAVVSLSCVATMDSIGAATAAIALTYATQLASQFQRLLNLMGTTENLMTSFERILYYDSLEEEGATREIVIAQPPSEWPTQGTIVFENVSVRYRDGLDLVLKDVSFKVQDGEKIGVCGRTGSGKSTLMSVLFRVVECANGRILIDGMDITQISVKHLRQQLTIIPQDPVLFSGSLRYNLDPFDEHSDEQVWTVLRKVRLYDDVSKWGHGLGYIVAEKGDNLSVGQRQLVCIARALLRESRIIVLDEATANVDQELDRLIQIAVKENFQHKTALTIAHRLETIADSDRILVLDDGEVKEYDSPANLLAKPGGIFASLMRSAEKK